MRRTALTVGLLLTILGFFLMNQGPQILTPLAETLGLASHMRTESPLIAPTLLTVPPTNRTWISTHLDNGAQVAGSFHVGTGREIDFYVMNEGEFYDWRAGRPATVLLGILSTSVYNFTLSLSSEGSYYFVFENQDSARRTVIFTLRVVRDVVIIPPTVEYLPIGLGAAGILLSIWGAVSGRKKPEPVAPTIAGWKCRFCDTDNPLNETFCQNCGRSQQ